MSNEDLDTCLICFEKFTTMVSLQQVLIDCDGFSVAEALANLHFLTIPDAAILYRNLCCICVSKVQSCFAFKALCAQIDQVLKTQAIHKDCYSEPKIKYEDNNWEITIEDNFSKIEKEEEKEANTFMNTGSSSWSSPESIKAGRREHQKVSYNSVTLDKKEIFVKYYEAGKTIGEAAELAGMNINTARSFLHRYRKDDCTIIQRNRGGSRRTKLTNEIVNEIEEIIEQDSSVTLKKISMLILKRKHVNLSINSVNNSLRKLKITQKRPMVDLLDVNSDLAIDQRKAFAVDFLKSAPENREKIIFIDEGVFNCHLRTHKARTKIEITPHLIVPTAITRSVSVVAAMNLQGIVCKKVVTKPSINSKIFLEFFEELILRLSEAGISDAWLVMDSIAIHKTQELCDRVAQTSHRIVYFPPFSPMLNPVAEIFPKIKLHARTLLGDPDNHTNLINVIESSIARISSEDSNDFFFKMIKKLSFVKTGEPLQKDSLIRDSSSQVFEDCEMNDLDIP